MIKRSSSLLKLRMWSTLRTIRTRMLPRIRMNSKTIPRKVGMLVPPNKAPMVLNRVQVPSKTLAAKKTVLVLVRAVPSKVLAAKKMVLALALVVPKRVLAVQVLSKAQVAKKTVRAQVRAARKMVRAQVRAARKMVRAQAEKRTVLALAERPARRMSTSLIKRRNSRSMIGEK
jgi:hypothetical protein